LTAIPQLDVTWCQWPFGLHPKTHHVSITLASSPRLPPGIINGGVVQSLFDCHGNWTAAIALMDNAATPKPPLTLTYEMLVRRRRRLPAVWHALACAFFCSHGPLCLCCWAKCIPRCGEESVAAAVLTAVYVGAVPRPICNQPVCVCASLPSMQTNFKDTTPPNEPLILRSQIMKIKGSDIPGTKPTVQVGGKQQQTAAVACRRRAGQAWQLLQCMCWLAGCGAFSLAHKKLLLLIV
jgi:hypothetical protein